VAKIKVINKVQPITYLPFAPASIAGIINFRGDMVSVTDLKKILGLPDSEMTETARLVVVESGTCATALLVDQIDEIITVPVSQIYAKLETIAPQTAEYIEAGCKSGKKLLGILNVERILQRDQ
jgi:purine-binding chemotaxis protein CheW